MDKVILQELKMKELVEQFKTEMMSKLFENNPRFIQWRYETTIINKMINDFKNLKEDDIVFQKITQKQLYEKSDMIILQTEFNLYFLFNPTIERFQNSLGAYSRYTDSMFLNLRNIGINKTNNFLNDKNTILQNLQFNSEMTSILHHELAHREFQNKFPDNYSYLTFKQHDFDTKGINSIEEQNSLLQELFHYAVVVKGVPLRSTEDFILFICLLSQSDNLYDKEVLSTLLQIQDIETFKDKLIKINNRLNNSRFRMNNTFEQFLNHLISNNVNLKSPIELIRYIINNKDKIPECQNMLALKKTMNYNNYFSGCLDLLKIINDKETFNENLLAEQLDYILNENVQDKEIMIDEFFKAIEPKDCITKYDLKQLKIGKERFIDFANKHLQDNDDKEKIIQQLKQIDV